MTSDFLLHQIPDTLKRWSICTLNATLFSMKSMTYLLKADIQQPSVYYNIHLQKSLCKIRILPNIPSAVCFLYSLQLYWYRTDKSLYLVSLKITKKAGMQSNTKCEDITWNKRMARFATPYEALNNRPVLSLLPLLPSIIKYTILIYTFTLKKITVFRNVFVEGDVHYLCYL